jgi:hypothetical protein
MPAGLPRAMNVRVFPLWNCAPHYETYLVTYAASLEVRCNSTEFVASHEHKHQFVARTHITSRHVKLLLPVGGYATPLHATCPTHP